MWWIMEVNEPAADYYKFCPGEEHIKLSNAICRGRRRIHFPKCHACQFNEDAAPSATPSPKAAGTPQPSSIEGVFRPHDICAAVPARLNADLAWRIGYAAAQFLHGRLRGYDRADRHAKSIIVGRDARPLSADLREALIEGIRATGVEVIDIGLIDTPQLYFAVNHVGTCGGIQVTGGAMPAGCGGFNICGAKAVPITSETGLTSIRDIAVRVPKHRTGTTSPLSSEDLSRPYRDFVRGFLRGRDRLAQPLKLVADASNGVAGRWLPILFDGVDNLSIVPLNYEPAGVFHHDPDPLDPANLRDLRRLVKTEKADFGVCFDGDASSCALVDERGNSRRSDHLAAVLARTFIGRLPGAAVVLDLRATRAAFEEVERAGGVPVASRVDVVSMKKTMSERGAVLGADLDGHFYFREGFFGESAILALVHVLNTLADSQRKLGDLVRPLHRYRSPGEIRFPAADPERTLQQLAAANPDAEIHRFDGITVRHPDWWFIARPRMVHGGWQDPSCAADPGPAVLVTLEARTKELLAEKLSHLQSLLTDQQ